ncbi:hypothetical protein [Candidatus Finniella inopinata]|uniref:Uncharacterized protein n=1 Tax=Candidatus Finniella inopinata TaxID=1696036 RepID=A0A4Q7DG61_9PROT|nr:hypothetical protein [Candidatus Finniella inopinata]RZI45831.1 hypothetical protein EQU50_05190 [Candidatus Finniella inopinata]
MNKIVALCVLALTVGMIGDCCRASSSASSSYEADYQRFLKVKLVYCPKKESDVGKIVLPIKELRNPLEGTFDLSGYDDTGQYLSIATGYPKEKNPENADKIEIWIAPRFLIEKELTTTAGHFKGIMSNWPSTVPVGIFWRWGGWNNLEWMDYLTTNSLEKIGDNNLYRKYQFSQNSDEENYNTTGMNMLKEHWRSLSRYKLES